MFLFLGDGVTDPLTDGPTDGETDGETEGQIDGRTDGQTLLWRCLVAPKTYAFFQMRKYNGI